MGSQLVRLSVAGRAEQVDPAARAKGQRVSVPPQGSLSVQQTQGHIQDNVLHGHSAGIMGQRPQHLLEGAVLPAPAEYQSTGGRQ